MTSDEPLITEDGLARMRRALIAAGYKVPAAQPKQPKRPWWHGAWPDDLVSSEGGVRIDRRGKEEAQYEAWVADLAAPEMPTTDPDGYPNRRRRRATMTENEKPDELGEFVRDATDAEEEMRSAVGRCHACSYLYSRHHYVSMWDAAEHEADVALQYLSDPAAAEKWIAESSYEPDELAKMFGDPAHWTALRLGLVPVPEKCAKAAEFVAQVCRRPENGDDAGADWFAEAAELLRQQGFVEQEDGTWLREPQGSTER